MRVIDLHCYPNTEPWIRCQGPYVEALAKYWKRNWTWKQEDEVVAEFAAAGVTVAVSAPPTIDIAQDKVQTHEWLSANGFPTVRQRSLDDAALDPAWPLPTVVKPVFGSSSLGLELVADRDRLRALAKRPGYIAQEVAPGVEFTVDVLVDSTGRAHAPVPRRRIETRSGEVSKARAEHFPHVESLVRELAERLPDAYGALNVQIFVDGESVKIIEINARFGGGYPLTDEVGVPHASWLVSDALGLPKRPSIPPKWGLTMLRYDEAVFVSGLEV